jgi:hypothetical protein
MGMKLGLTLREERRLRVSYSRALRNIHGPTKNEVTVEWSVEDYIMKSFVLCTPYQILFG